MPQMSTAAEVSAAETHSDVRTIIQRIHDSPVQACIYATGGGMQAITWLLTAPGASRTVLETRIPYSPRAMEALLDQVPSKAACTQTAVDLAGAAYQQAANLTAFGSPIVGFGCTCALATDRVKKGDHKVIMAARNDRGCTTWEVVLDKGSRTRIEEDTIASRLLVALLAEAADVATSGFDSGLLDSEDLQMFHYSAKETKAALEDLLRGSVRSVEFARGQITVDAPRCRRVYLPGSFNPLHDGHRKLLAAAVKAAGDDAEGCFEMSVGNPDKGSMDIGEVLRRLQPFQESGSPLVVVQAPLFTEKAALFPGAVFVVGYDTAVRLVDEQYYSSQDPMAVQFQRLAAAGCRIMVAGRATDEGGYLTLADIRVPDTLERMDLFEAIPEDVFRVDISSTQLRKQAAS